MTRLKRAAIAVVLCALSSAAQAGSTNDALAAFQTVCLGNDTNFNNWRETFQSFGVADAGRLQDRLPTAYPSGDVIFYTGKYAGQSKTNAKRDCNILLKGDQTREAVRAVKQTLRRSPWSRARKSDVYYIPSEREALAFDASYVLHNLEEVILIVIRTTNVGNAGLLTALNATVYRNPHTQN